MDAKKDALKKVIALMTVGQDVSKLFIDIINCMQQGDIEMKKLVYLYLINYADEKPDLALLAVQSFINVGVCLFCCIEWFFLFNNRNYDGFCDIYNILLLLLLLLWSTESYI